MLRLKTLSDAKTTLVSKMSEYFMHQWWEDTVSGKPKCWTKNRVQPINSYHVNILGMSFKLSVCLIWEESVLRVHS
jgi:hypothetical protein